MKPPIIFGFFIIIFLVHACGDSKPATKGFEMKNRMVRIAEMEIDSNYIAEYNAILKEEAEASVRLESGVICIYPMFQKDNPTKIRILEIYANEAAYRVHLKTPHFLHYKKTTLNMVKSLKLVDMEAIDEASMSKIFGKMKL